MDCFDEFGVLGKIMLVFCVFRLRDYRLQGCSVVHGRLVLVHVPDDLGV